MTEPEVGEYVRSTGAVICHIMRPSYIGQKVLYDCSTQSMRNLYKCGILEQYIPYEGRYRSVIYDGRKQRVLLTHYPGARSTSAYRGTLIQRGQRDGRRKNTSRCRCRCGRADLSV